MARAGSTRAEVKTPLDIYLQRRNYGYITLAYQHAAIPARAGTVPGAGISPYPVSSSSYLSKWIKPGAK